MRIIGNTAATTAMNEVLSSRALPKFLTQTSGNVRIGFGTPSQVKVLIGNEFAIDAAPANGDYQIILKNKTIVVIGGDETGLLSGAKVLENVIEAAEESHIVDIPGADISARGGDFL